MSQFYTIHAGQSFAAVAADFLLENYAQKSAFGLSDVTLLVPSHRVGQTLRQALSERLGDGGFLPNIQTLSVDDDLGDQLALYQPAEALGQPVVPPMERVMVFTRQILAMDPNLSAKRAMENAFLLAALCDRLTTYGINLADAQAVLPAEMADHWQKNIQFLSIVMGFYPQWLVERGEVDGAMATRQQQLALAEYIKTLANKPVLAVGFTDSTPAGRVVLQAVADYDQGVVIFPGLSVDVLSAQDLLPSHPFFTLKKLAQDLGVTVDNLDVLGVQDPPVRAQIWQRSLADVPQIWPEAVYDFALIEAATQQEEAEAVALAMMDAVLGQKEPQATLVTPDRALALRVAAVLKARGIVPNDSAGVPLLQTSVGRLALLVLKAVQEGMSSACLAELVNHPEVCLCEDVSKWNNIKKSLLGVLLQKTPMQSGVAGLYERLDAVKKQRIDFPHSCSDVELSSCEEGVGLLVSLFSPFVENKGMMRSVSGWRRRHWDVLQQMLQKDAGAVLRSDAGDALLSLFESWEQGAVVLGDISFHAYVFYLEVLLEKVQIRPSWGYDNRFKILGPLEGRLQVSGVVVIAGVNEDVWPKMPKADPWLGRQLQAALGLPDPDVAVGMNGSDFLSLATAECLIMSRTLTDAGSPTIPSRMLSRLEVVLPDDVMAAARQRGRRYLQMSQQLRRQGGVDGFQSLVVSPPLAVRPQKWSASLVKKLMGCPYQVYAERILGLSERKPFDKPVDGGKRGDVVHQIMEALLGGVEGLPAPFVPKTPADRGPAIARFMAIARQVLSESVPMATAAVWLPRLELLAEEIVDQLIADEMNGRGVIQTEADAAHVFSEGVVLKARADRVDRTAEGGLVVVDYKTGAYPEPKDFKTGADPQLPVEGLLVQAGAFGEGELAGWEVWKVRLGGQKLLEVKRTKDAPLGDIMLAAKDGVQALANYFQNEENPYFARPQYGAKSPCTFCAYAGVCRHRDNGFVAFDFAARECE